MTHRTDIQITDNEGRKISNKVYSDNAGREFVKRHGMIGYLEIVSDKTHYGKTSSRRVITKRVAYYTANLEGEEERPWKTR